MKRCPKCGKSYPDEANFCPTDAARLVSVATDAIPAAAITSHLVAGRFELGPVIGGHSTGEVHRATDTQGGAAVAVKLVDPAVLAIPQVAQRIDRELKQLERVQHKGVAHVIASGKHAEREFVVTELIEGARPLAELIAASGPLDPQRASDLVVAIGEALIEAAKVGVVHRDLAPKNVLVTQDSLRLINFAVPTPSVTADKVAGVPEFASPESIEGKPVDQRSNIYSLASIYYFLLTGRAPHTGTPAEVIAAHLAGATEAPSKHAAVPADVDSLVLRALERNPAKRFLTLRQFLDDVERVARGPEGGVGATAPFGRAGGTKSRELSSTLMGFGMGGADKMREQIAAKTKAMDVQIPPEAMREEAPPPKSVTKPLAAAAPPNMQAAPAPAPSSAPDPYAPAAAAMAAAAPSIGAVGAAGAQASTDGSPWGRPASAAPGPASLDAQYGAAAAAMQTAAPAVGAAAQAKPPSAQMPAAPKVAASASGKKKPPGEEQKSSKGKFRETMWFKKGELDAQAAEDAAKTGDAAATDKADLMPIEERYGDDGTITRSDAEKYSLKTGATSMMAAVKDDGSSSAAVSERELVGEMKKGRNVIFIVIVVVVVLACGIIAALNM